MPKPKGPAERAGVTENPHIVEETDEELIAAANQQYHRLKKKYADATPSQAPAMGLEKTDDSNLHALKEHEDMAVETRRMLEREEETQIERWKGSSFYAPPDATDAGIVAHYH